MRITNNMIMHNTSHNINGNKINVDILNNQMSSQKKIQRPSEDPVIAVRALRLRSALSEVNQYYQKNIPDAEAWLEVTDTAILNMVNLVGSIRTEADYAAGDDLTETDRQSILEQMQKLREQVYLEGNADYAGRTVFTGYHTDQKLTFLTDEKDTKYSIEQRFDYKDIEEHRYYSGNVTLPTTTAELMAAGAISKPDESVYDRIRLGYAGIEGVPTVNYTPKGGTETAIAPTVFANYAQWEAASTEGYTVADDAAVFIQETGELVLGKDLSSELKSGKADLTIEYEKTGFSKGELRPEYYYNCERTADDGHTIKYTKFDENGKEIFQDINFTIAPNQELTVNSTASEIFDASLGRDMDELIDAVQSAIAAHQKLTDLKSMKKLEEYSSDEYQAKLDDWIEAAGRECDYYDDNMQKLFNSCIGKCDKYLVQLDLAQTVVGSKGQNLDLVNERMSQQQTTIDELRSSNEDRELSDIIIDYTAAYNAYTASLQAAAKANQSHLLNYI